MYNILCLYNPNLLLALPDKLVINFVVLLVIAFKIKNCVPSSVYFEKKKWVESEDIYNNNHTFNDINDHVHPHTAKYGSTKLSDRLLKWLFQNKKVDLTVNL